jgi:hypothetical protein
VRECFKKIDTALTAQERRGEKKQSKYREKAKVEWKRKRQQAKLRRKPNFHA